jgi:hypothetical protein
MRTRALVASLSLVSMFAACGGSQPSAQVPAAAASASAAPVASAEAPKAEPADKKAEPAEKKPEPGSTAALATEVGRDAMDVMTLKDAVFMVVFEDSDPGKKADQICGKEPDPKKKAACLAKERGKMDYDGVRFTKNKDGKWIFIAYRHRGNRLTMLHKILFQFASDQKGKTVTINFEGKDTGSAPYAKVPAKLSFEVESDYRISHGDPRMGKMYFEAKVGIAGSDIPN